MKQRTLRFWMIVNALGLNRPVSKLICRSGRYHQYQTGVCGWCGKPHVKVSGVKHLEVVTSLKRQYIVDTTLDGAAVSRHVIETMNKQAQRMY